MYTSTGTLQYFKTWAVLMVDPDLGRYYRSFIPKHISWQVPMYPMHVTAVREAKETPKNLQFWRKYDGERIEFTYDPDIHIESVYIWLRVYCDRLSEIRRELGLPQFFDRFREFHITIANRKGL